MERRARRITPHDYDRQPSILGWLLRRYEQLVGDLGNARTAALVGAGLNRAKQDLVLLDPGADMRDHASAAARRQTAQGLWITENARADKP